MTENEFKQVLAIHDNRLKSIRYTLYLSIGLVLIGLTGLLLSGCTSVPKKQESGPGDYVCVLQKDSQVYVTLKGTYNSLQDALDDAEEVNLRLNEKGILVGTEASCELIK